MDNVLFCHSSIERILTSLMKKLCEEIPCDIWLFTMKVRIHINLLFCSILTLDILEISSYIIILSYFLMERIREKNPFCYVIGPGHHVYHFDWTKVIWITVDISIGLFKLFFSMEKMIYQLFWSFTCRFGEFLVLFQFQFCFSFRILKNNRSCAKVTNLHNKFRVPVLMLKTVTFESHNSKSI